MHGSSLAGIECRACGDRIAVDRNSVRNCRVGVLVGVGGGRWGNNTIEACTVGIELREGADAAISRCEVSGPCVTDSFDEPLHHEP